MVTHILGKDKSTVQLCLGDYQRSEMKTIEELVDDALTEVREYLISTPPYEPEEWEDSPKQRYVGGEHPIDHGKVARLRLDWELAGENRISVNDNEHIARLISEALKWDLVDVIKNGDIEINNDPLLKAMNGSVKLNKSPIKIIIEELTWFREERPKKECYDYTIFMLLKVDWEE